MIGCPHVDSPNATNEKTTPAESMKTIGKTARLLSYLSMRGTTKNNNNTGAKVRGYIHEYTISM